MVFFFCPSIFSPFGHTPAYIPPSKTALPDAVSTAWRTPQVLHIHSFILYKGQDCKSSEKNKFRTFPIQTEAKTTVKTFFCLSKNGLPDCKTQLPSIKCYKADTCRPINKIDLSFFVMLTLSKIKKLRARIVSAHGVFYAQPRPVAKTINKSAKASPRDRMCRPAHRIRKGRHAANFPW